jgi:nitroreductase
VKRRRRIEWMKAAGFHGTTGGFVNRSRAETSVPIHDLLAERWSPVVFDGRPIEPQALRALLEAARWAPSSFNEQPWAYIVSRREDHAEFEKLASVLVEGNAWARQASLLILSVAKLDFDHNGKPNHHAWHDVGMSSLQMIIQAVAFGLRAHQMAGYNAKKARELFSIPEGWEPVAMMAIGYHDPDGPAPEGLRKREASPRRRKALESFVFSGTWGTPATALK